MYVTKDFCENHHDRDGELCIDCGKYFCKECMSTTHKYLCKNCAESLPEINKPKAVTKRSVFTLPLVFAVCLLLMSVLRHAGFFFLSVPIAFFIF
jgi:hypothetical protein